MFEVEMKARVLDPKKIEQLIAPRARFLKRVDKSDEYFILPQSGFPFRIRQDGAQTVITVKEKTWDGSVEINREFESSIDDATPVRKLAAAAGFVEDFRKTKRGVSYDLDGIHVEIVEVPPLGHFVEAELVLEDDADRQLAVNRIRQLFQELGIPEEDCERKYYRDLLREHG